MLHKSFKFFFLFSFGFAKEDCRQSLTLLPRANRQTVAAHKSTSEKSMNGLISQVNSQNVDCKDVNA